MRGKSRISPAICESGDSEYSIGSGGTWTVQLEIIKRVADFGVSTCQFVIQTNRQFRPVIRVLCGCNESIPPTGNFDDRFILGTRQDSTDLMVRRGARARHRVLPSY